MMNTNQIIARTYARCGVYVFPCREGNSGNGKAKAPYLSGGFHTASTNEKQICNWWRGFPNAAIGLPCRPNGIIVIDADRHGQEDGVAAFLALCVQRNFDVNSVPCIATPRNGRHYLFRRPKNLGDTKGKIATAIDVRDRAYVIAAGSVMANGLSYSLQNGSIEQLAAAIGGAALPELPDWLLALIAKPVSTPKQTAGYVAHPAIMPCGDVRKRVKGLICTVALANPGERNNVLHWAACRMAEIIKDSGLQPITAIAMLVEAGMNVGLSKAEAQATAESGVYNSNVSAGYGN